MERFDFDMSADGDTMIITCPLRNLKISGYFIPYIPSEIPDNMLLCFCSFNPIPGSKLAQDKQTFMGFLINDPGNIKYELFLTQNLIHNAISNFAIHILGQPFAEITYSEAYRKKFIDSLPTDPSKISAALREFIASGEWENGTDFYEWKEIKYKTALN